MWYGNEPCVILEVIHVLDKQSGNETNLLHTIATMCPNQYVVMTSQISQVSVSTHAAHFELGTGSQLVGEYS